MSSGITSKIFTLLRKANIAFLCQFFFYNFKFSELVVSFPHWHIYIHCRAPRSHGPHFARGPFIHYALTYSHGPRFERCPFFIYWDFRSRSPPLHGLSFTRGTSLIFNYCSAPRSQIHRFMRHPFNISCKCVKIALHAHYQNVNHQQFLKAQPRKAMFAFLRSVKIFDVMPELIISFIPTVSQY